MRKAGSGTLLAAAMLVACGLAAGAPSAAAQTRVIMSNETNAVGVKGQTFEVLKREIEKRLGNKVAVELHHSGTLFDQKTQIQGLQLGSVHLIAPTQGIYAPIAPKINALSLPFLLTTPEAVQAAVDDPVVKETIFGDLEKKNIRPVAIWINGPRDFSSRGKALLTPADMKGVKIRVQSVPVDIETMKTVGANVVGMSWSEVPTALRQGVIDAVEPTPNALVGAGLHEMVDHIVRVEYQFSFYVVGANKQWWNGLAPDVRSAIEEALKVATAWNWENTGKENAAAYGKAKAAGKQVHTLTAEQRAQWVAAVGPVWKKYGESAIGPAAMKRLEEIGAKHR